MESTKLIETLESILDLTRKGYPNTAAAKLDELIKEAKGVQVYNPLQLEIDAEEPTCRLGGIGATHDGKVTFAPRTAFDNLNPTVEQDGVNPCAEIYVYKTQTRIVYFEMDRRLNGYAHAKKRMHTLFLLNGTFEDYMFALANVRHATADECQHYLDVKSSSRYLKQHEDRQSTSN